MTDELLWELSSDELEKLLKGSIEEDPIEENPSEEEVRPMLDDTKVLDDEDTAALDDKGEDSDDELNTPTDELVAAATDVLEKALLSPPPPPQDANKVTNSNNVLIFNCLNDAIVINDLQGCILNSPRTRQAKHRCVILIL